MEDESRMNEVDLKAENGGGDHDTRSQNAKKTGGNEMTPAMETIVAAFTSSPTKGKRVDLNKNSATNSQESGSAFDKDSAVTGSKPKPKLFHVDSAVDIKDSFEIATKDDIDAGNTSSLIMKRDFLYYFQHPYIRLLTTFLLTFCNFLIYAEDPMAHSKTECNIEVFGNDFAFVFTKYLPNAWSLLKVFLWVTGTIVGLIVGKLFVHKFVLNRVLRLKMFSHGKGSWMTMFFTVIFSVFIFSYIYNLFLKIGGDYTEPYAISSYMGITNETSMKAAGTITWCGDFLTIWTVTDIMLQEKLYPGWAKPVRKWWNTGYNRTILLWMAAFSSSFVVIFVIATDYIDWDSLNRDLLHTNEISRALLASFILVLDITIVMQDWEFPHFVSTIDIKLPGINKAHIHFQIPKLKDWKVHISGKWCNYGVLVLVIFLDLDMWVTQIFFSPFDYGQYVDPDGRIYSIEDDYSLHYANKSTLTFEYRNHTISNVTGKYYILDDVLMNSRYNGYSLALKSMAFIPSLMIFLVFGIMVAIYGRRPKPTKKTPYGSRLLKRKKRFSPRRAWNIVRGWFVSTEPAPSQYQPRYQESGTEC